MSALRDTFFWASYGKLATASLVGSALSTLIGVPVDTAATLAAGAIISFPGAYGFAQRSGPRPSANVQP